MNSIPSVNWPQCLQEGLPLTKILECQRVHIPRETFPPKHIAYIYQLVSNRKLKLSTFELCLSMATIYKTNQTKFVQCNQLLLLVCIFIASKLMEHEPISIGELHYVSNHCYTNKDIYRMEAKVLTSVDFDPLKNILCSHQVKLILKMVEKFVKGYYEVLEKVSQDIEVLILNHLYTKASKLEKKFEPLLPLAIVQMALMFATQCSGKFPPTMWVMKVMDINEDDINNMVEELMKIVLGKERYSEISL